MTEVSLVVCSSPLRADAGGVEAGLTAGEDSADRGKERGRERPDAATARE